VRGCQPSSSTAFQTYGWKALLDPQKLDTMADGGGCEGSYDHAAGRHFPSNAVRGRRRVVAKKKKGGKPNAVVEDSANKGHAGQAGAEQSPRHRRRRKKSAEVVRRQAVTPLIPEAEAAALGTSAGAPRGASSGCGAAHHPVGVTGGHMFR